MKTFQEFIAEAKTQFTVEFQYNVSRNDEIVGYRAVVIGSAGANDVKDVIEAKDLKSVLNSAKFKKLDIAKAIVGKKEVKLNQADIEKALKTTI